MFHLFHSISEWFSLEAVQYIRGVFTQSNSSLGYRGSLTERAADWQVILKVRLATWRNKIRFV